MRLLTFLIHPQSERNECGRLDAGETCAGWAGREFGRRLSCSRDRLVCLLGDGKRNPNGRISAEVTTWLLGWLA